MYKYENSAADYLFMNVSKFQRSLLAQFRCGILPLEIEVGRYVNKPISERICRVCEQNLVEDEIHFLCDCTKYSAERQSRFEKACNSNDMFTSLDSFEKFVYLMGNHERAVISFLTKAVQKRRQSLYDVS